MTQTLNPFLFLSIFMWLWLKHMHTEQMAFTWYNCYCVFDSGSSETNLCPPPKPPGLNKIGILVWMATILMRQMKLTTLILWSLPHHIFPYNNMAGITPCNKMVHRPYGLMLIIWSVATYYIVTCILIASTNVKK